MNICSMQKINDNDVRKIVLSYLVHNCFKETAETFISCTGMKRSVDCSVDIDKRKRTSLFTNILQAVLVKQRGWMSDEHPHHIPLEGKLITVLF